MTPNVVVEALKTMQQFMAARERLLDSLGMLDEAVKMLPTSARAVVNRIESNLPLIDQAKADLASIDEAMADLANVDGASILEALADLVLIHWTVGDLAPRHRINIDRAVADLANINWASIHRAVEAAELCANA